MGLIGEHCYAVEDLALTADGARNLLIKNPWCDAPLMTGIGRFDSRGAEKKKYVSCLAPCLILPTDMAGT